ncbi:MAG: hypothetical protein ABIT01_19460, partial [Thermoanaerobaculia bacterium]
SGTVLDQPFQLVRRKPFTGEVDLGGAASATIALSCTNAEAEVVAQRADGTGARVTRATRGGTLDFLLAASEFTAEGSKKEPANRIKFTVTTDAPKAVACRLLVTPNKRSGR